ncbi:CHAT domain-containing protein [Seohaeicola saemankumensis]|nr:CHAT domain-containing protein [Seohaeicola saemankumensis]MCA0871117.1 CHAT domain-containing protein [Seohaeicola saemankumensis]
MRARLAALALIAGLGLGPAAAQTPEPDLQAMHRSTLEAFQAGDGTLAMARATAALDAARAMAAPDAGAYGHALNNLAYLTATVAGDTARAARLWQEAITYLAARGQLAGEAGFTALTQLAAQEIRQGDTAAALPRLRQALSLSRDTPLHAVVANITVGLFLDASGYADAVLALTELTQTDPSQIATTYGALYGRFGTLADTAETEGRAGDLAALIEGKMVIARTFLTGADRDGTLRNLRFQRYFALHNAGQYDRARQELLAWLTSGPLSDEEQRFVREMAETAMQLGDGASIDTLDRLETARTAITFARGLPDPDALRLAQAMRAVATAEGYFGQQQAAARSLREAIAILERNAEGRRHLHLYYDHLAWTLHQSGDADGAARLFDAADAARTADAQREPAIDRAVAAGNRARFFLDTGAPEQADLWLARARDAVAEATDDPWLVASQRVRLMNLAAMAAIDRGAADIPVAPLIAAIDDLRPLAPPGSPDFALTLVNAADTALVAGWRDPARALLAEAVTINDTALPDIAPQSIDTRAKLAQLDLVEGRLDAATQGFHRLTEARKSPLYRAQLAQAGWDFELFAWTLLQQDRAAEAFEALQWTHVTRSAQALSALETRLAVTDPNRAALLSRRRDLTEEQAATLARLTAAPAGAQAQVLSARVRQIETELSEVETTLNALGLDTAGIGRIDPVPLAEVQRLLAPDEALVTFLLPSLAPAMIQGLEGSSNHVIALTRDSVTVARIPEISRRALNDRITRFRCQVAVSDPGCGTGGAQGLRGAMVDEEETGDAGGFDTALAHGLYADLFAPVAGAIAGRDHLIVVPPSDLLRLPFAALAVTPADPGQPPDWMIRHHALSVLPSVGSLRALRRTRPAPDTAETLLGIGDPVIGRAQSLACDSLQLAALRAAPPLQTPLDTTGSLADPAFLSALPRLPDTVCELRAIASGFAADRRQLILGAEATETRIKSLNQSGALAAADVLVFATHGLTAGEAGANSPGLVMTPPRRATEQDDGLLTAAEIATMDMNARLVVLSACNTAAGGSGDADGLSGLARAFFQAGAQSLLVTHWSVYSSAAVDITTGLFDARRATPDLRHADALRAATLAILDNPGRPAFHYHPSYWAAFTVVGAD